MKNKVALVTTIMAWLVFFGWWVLPSASGKVLDGWGVKTRYSWFYQSWTGFREGGLSGAFNPGFLVPCCALVCGVASLLHWLAGCRVSARYFVVKITALTTAFMAVLQSFTSFAIWGTDASYGTYLMLLSGITLAVLVIVMKKDFKSDSGKCA